MPLPKSRAQKNYNRRKTEILNLPSHAHCRLLVIKMSNYWISSLWMDSNRNTHHFASQHNVTCMLDKACEPGVSNHWLRALKERPYDISH
jgi:hypothetical protein